MDGIDEAMGELISALRTLSKLLNQHQKIKHNSTTSINYIADHRNGNKSIIHPPTIKQAASTRRSSMRFRRSARNKSYGSGTDIPGRGSFQGSQEGEVTVFGDGNYYSTKQTKQTTKHADREYAAKLKEEVEQIWKREGTMDKFIELEDLMEARANSRKLMAVVFINRIQSIIITVFSAFIVLYLYLLHEFELHGYNCLLPESHYYEVPTEKGVFTWRTTSCYFKAISVWTLMSLLLFTFYCIGAENYYLTNIEFIMLFNKYFSSSSHFHKPSFYRSHFGTQT